MFSRPYDFAYFGDRVAHNTELVQRLASERGTSLLIVLSPGVVDDVVIPDGERYGVVAVAALELVVECDQSFDVTQIMICTTGARVLLNDRVETRIAGRFVIGVFRSKSVPPASQEFDIRRS